MARTWEQDRRMVLGLLWVVFAWSKPEAVGWVDVVGAVIGIGYLVGALLEPLAAWAGKRFAAVRWAVQTALEEDAKR